MLYFLNYFLGFVRLYITTPYPERFLNILAQKGISFWALSREDVNAITICMPVSDFFSLRPIARRTSSRIHIIGKYGFPFFAARFKKRLPLILSFCILAIALWVMTSFIWVIDVSGCKTVSKDKLMEHLSYNGVKIGAYSKKIDYAALKNDMLLALPELINITVNINGSHARVEVHERNRAPEVVDYSHPSNIISDYDGIITKITVTSGMPEVSVGDAVRRGDLLAGGYMVGRAGTTVNMRAIADIRAKTLECVRVKFPDITYKKTYSGKEKTQYTLILGNLRINLHFRGGNLHTDCDKIIDSTRLSLSDKLPLPIALEKCTLREFSLTPEKVRSHEYIEARAEEYIELGDSDIISDIRAEREDECVILYAECERKVGVEQMIPEGE